jgi:hypothetical protein
MSDQVGSISGIDAASRRTDAARHLPVDALDHAKSFHRAFQAFGSRRKYPDGATGRIRARGIRAPPDPFADRGADETKDWRFYGNGPTGDRFSTTAQSRPRT